MALVDKKILDGYLTQFQDQIEQVWQEVGQDLGISKYQTELVIDDFFKRLRLAIEDPRLPTIYIEGFIIFYTGNTYLRRRIATGISRVKKALSKYSLKKLKSFVRLHWENYKRLQHERVHKRSHKPIDQIHYQDVDEFYASNLGYEGFSKDVKSEKQLLTHYDNLSRRKRLYDLPEEYPFKDETIFKKTDYLPAHIKKKSLLQKGRGGEEERLEAKKVQLRRRKKKIRKWT